MANPALENKVKTLEQLLPIITAAKASGKTIVTNNGSYDIMHLGHVEGLFFSKQQGDLLIVGVNSDASVKAYKDPSRPINDEHMRARMLAALACVDYVFTFDDTTPISWLDQIKPDIHTNGAEYGDDCIERNCVESHGGKVVLIPMINGYKTTAIIQRIRNSKHNED